MSFALAVLATCLMASAVLGRSTPSSSAVIDYEESDVRTAEQTTTAVMDVRDDGDDDDDRSSNLSYVMAVQNSSIWTEVRKRSLTIATEPQLDEIVDRPPAELSDRDLSALRRACHDGLKCVAVDQLMVLRKSVTGSAWSSDESVRMAVTRITAVITNYTTEYHSDEYRYEAVTESDDATKANSSVTAIVEDNRQLCQIPDGNGGTYTIVKAEHSESRAYSEDGADDDGALEDGADDDGAPEDGAEDAALENQMQVVAPENGKQEAADDSTGSSGGNETITNWNSGDQNYGTINNYHINYGTVNDATVNTDGSDVHLTLGDDTADRSDDATANRSDDDTAARGKPSSEHDRHEKCGDNDAGAKTAGYVGEGHLNNGKMVTYNQNNGTINKGEFDNVDASNGVVNVGTVNTGPTNYGTVSSNTNNGTVQQLRDVDLKKYASNVENMYVDVLRGFVKNGIDVSD